MTIHIFGIRHHGPGSAHSLKQALQALEPDIVLIEGPPDADALIPIAAQAGMKPPVALLIYATEQPQQAVYYPFAEFSPEWQGLQYALARGIAVQFMDLPQAYQLQVLEAEIEDTIEALNESETGTIPEITDETAAPTNPSITPDILETLTDQGEFLPDPLDWLAKAAGDSDAECWWERLVEQRQDSTDLFQAILEAMQALRSELPDLRNTQREQQREAFMRTTIRNAQKQGFSKIAVVCGAWHAPALAEMLPVKQDQALLKGLTKTKVSATWIPWTQGRLALRTGYGAGIESPGWYQHLWQSYNPQPKRRSQAISADPKTLISTRWLTHVARLLRKQGLDASSASVIEAIRLAESLAALRHYPLPGLAELNEATQTVLCFGDELPMRVIHEQLIINDRLGKVPSETPMVPLQQDLQRWQKRLRLKPSPELKELVLDLRQETDLLRSHLFHRLNLLGIPWGKAQTTRSKGTFKEGWAIVWKPQFEVQLIEKGTWGNTLEVAATAYLGHLAQTADNLPALTELLDRALLADLTSAIPTLMQRIQAEAAIAQDISHLMNAVPPLAQVMRYGNVRSFNADTLYPIVQGLVTRICISLPLACGNLDDDAAAQMDQHLIAVNQAINLLQLPDLTESWQRVLQQLADQSNLTGLIAGRCCRLLLDAGILTADTVADRLSVALSIANQPAQSAAWISGLLKGSGLLLLHNHVLLQVIDDWLSQLAADHFSSVLPLLRRTFSDFPAAERRQMGQQVRQGFGHGRPAEMVNLDLDYDRANAVIPMLQLLLGPRSG
ncbi:DUF5682 family protein [Alkalinema pantanalense CENA528]|uniref:DUF5682 family protein n=1 Tax=Alkalinema pantanalense TaxID=1620705 RepID=UPI003D6E79C7